MTRLMADSVTSADIPPGYPLVAYYVDGLYAWTVADRRRHQASRQVGIAVAWQTADAQVLDVENGDATPEQAVGWSQTRRAMGHQPVIYCNQSTLAAVEAAFHAKSVGLPAFWIALWDGVASLPPQWLAKQYANPTITGGHYDLSVVSDGYWEGVDPAPPAPAPAPAPAPPPAPPPPPLPAPVPVPDPTAPPFDQTRSAWGALAGFLTSTLPGAIRELLHLLGIIRNTP
jgi:hypothetical protein